MVDTLAPLSKEFLAAPYEDIATMYEEACYEYAKALFDAARPFDALPYFREIAGSEAHPDVENYYLQMPVYQAMGTWRSNKGYIAEFREDGTCTVLGENYGYYNFPSRYTLSLGDGPDSARVAYEVLDQSANKLNLRVINTTSGEYYFTRVTEDEPAATEAE